MRKKIKRMYGFILGAILISNAFPTKDFYVFEETPLPHEIGMFRHVQYTLDKNIDAYATIFNEKMRAEIFQQPMNNPLDSTHLNEISKQHDITVAINGGFFTKTFIPAGLFIENGIRIRPMASRSVLLTTCVSVDRHQKLYLKKNREDCLSSYSAMQTGPLIIDHGEINQEIYSAKINKPKFNSFFSGNRRTILAETENHEIIAMVTTSATFNQIAHILRFYPESLGVKKIQIALDLDGGLSTGMYVRFAKEPFYFFEQRHVKTVILFY